MSTEPDTSYPETGNVVETTDPVIQRVPLALRQEYMAKWEAYGATCRLRRPKKECEAAFEPAMDVFHRYVEAVRKAQAEHDAAKVEQIREGNRAKARSASATPSLKIR